METPWGLHEESVRTLWGLCGDSVGTLWGLCEDSVRTPWGLHEDSMRTLWGLWYIWYNLPCRSVIVSTSVLGSLLCCFYMTKMLLYFQVYLTFGQSDILTNSYHTYMVAYIYSSSPSMSIPSSSWSPSLLSLNLCLFITCCVWIYNIACKNHFSPFSDLTHCWPASWLDNSLFVMGHPSWLSFYCICC